MRISPLRVSPLTEEEHRQIVVNALRDFNLSPAAVGWHYLCAALKHYGSNISATARGVGIQRRTVQRMLEQKRL